MQSAAVGTTAISSAPEELTSTACRLGLGLVDGFVSRMLKTRRGCCGSGHTCRPLNSAILATHLLEAQ